MLKIIIISLVLGLTFGTIINNKKEEKMNLNIFDATSKATKSGKKNIS